MVELTHIAKCLLWRSLSARRCVSCAHKHVHVLRTKDGAAHVSSDEDYICAASLNKYAFTTQNAYLFIDCSIENGIAVVYWRGGEW